MNIPEQATALEAAVSDEQLVAIAIEHGFGISMEPEHGFPHNALWFDANPLPMLHTVLALRTPASEAAPTPQPATPVAVSKGQTAEPVPSSEPVAWRYKDSHNHWRYVGHRPDAGYDSLLKPEPLYATLPAPQAAEPSDIEDARAILARLCDEGYLRMSIPVRDKDDDMILKRVIDAAALAAGPATPAVEPKDKS